MDIDPSKIKKHKVTGIEDPFMFGVYVWQMPDGKVLGKDGDVLNVPSQKGDIRKMSAIREYVNKELGIFSGEPLFLPGATRISDYEHDGQMEQLLNGHVPSMDLGSLRDDIINEKRRAQQ